MIVKKNFPFKKVYVAGHNGMVGSSIVRKLKTLKKTEIITADKKNLNLLDKKKVRKFLSLNKPDLIIIAAAKVGGIKSNNTFPADFIYENLSIQVNLINSAHEEGINSIVFLGSSCIYPRDSYQPIKERDLLGGYLEKTNEPYAIAKISGIKMCESYNRQFDRDYRSFMPTNLYGLGDTYDLENGHVLPSLIKKLHLAKINNEEEVIIWGSGNQLREFLYSEDLADAIIFLSSLEKKEYEKNIKDSQSHINIGSGNEISIKDLSELIKNIVGYKGKLIFDRSKLEGTPRKLLDSSIIKGYGWNCKTSLEAGVKAAYKDFLENHN